jgi:hypothetical protein
MSSRNANKNQVLLQGRHIESIISLKKIGNSRRHRRRRSSSMSLSNKVSKAGGVPQFTADEKLFDRDDRKFITSAPQIAISQFHFFSKREREREREREI